MNLFDRLARGIRDRIKTFDESGMGYWRIKAVLDDGRIFTNVYINDLYGLGFQDKTPFKLRDIVDVMWDGYRGREPSGVPIELVSAAPISPWTDIATLPSPDGHKRATIVNAMEIAM